MKLNEKIKKRRTDLNLTLSDIASFVGVTEATIQRYESGEIKTLKTSTIIKLAEILKTTPIDLMGWEEVEPNSSLSKEFAAIINKAKKLTSEDFNKADKIINATLDAFLDSYDD